VQGREGIISCRREHAMLVISRKDREQACIGDNIVITVRRVRGNRVRIAIDAPDSVRIVRRELTHPANRAAVPPIPSLLESGTLPDEAGS
jgi:carbon storage regulator